MSKVFRRPMFRGGSTNMNGINQQVVQTATAMPAASTMNQGLTPTENALYSEEEKQITLRNRGLA